MKDRGQRSSRIRYGILAQRMNCEPNRLTLPQLEFLLAVKCLIRTKDRLAHRAWYHEYQGFMRRAFRQYHHPNCRTL